MNKQLLLLLPMLPFQVINAQEKNVVELLTSEKWYAEYAIVEDKKIEFPTETQKETWILLLPKGQAEFMVKGEKGTGEWNYNATSCILKIIKGNDIEEHKLITIAYKRMIIQETGEEDAIIGWRK